MKRILLSLFVAAGFGLPVVAGAYCADPAIDPCETTTEPPLPGRTGAQLRRAEQDLRRMDADRSGELDTAEVSSVPGLQARFGDYDLDDTGTLSLNEYQSWLAAQPNRRNAEV